MFLFQKLNYNFYHLTTTIQPLIDALNTAKELPNLFTFDTETTGLDHMKDKAFVFGVAFDTSVFVMEISLLDEVYKVLPKTGTYFAHNAKFDWHMLLNSGYPFPLTLADSKTVARLTEYADGEMGLSLEDLGTRYVDPESKFASKVIKEHINQINAKRLRELKRILKTNEELKKDHISVGDLINEWHNKVQFVAHPWEKYFDLIDSLYTKPNYLDSYKEKPDLMLYYLADDCVILLEYLKKALSILRVTDPDSKIFSQEKQLIEVVGNYERNGLRADVDYLLEARERVLNYKEKLYKLLHEKSGVVFQSGQHKVLKKLFFDNYGIELNKTDMGALESVAKTYPNTIQAEIANLIIELRTIDKWLSTYIEGMLNRVYNGRIYTSIDNAGAVTGRVSCDLQQQPKEPLLDRDGNELFHPRRVFINDEGGKMYYFDFSQMELRVQAHYTVLVSGGDLHLCRAFIPFKCKSVFTDEIFDVHNQEHDYKSGEWIDESGILWEPTDLHTVTALKAFPNVTTKDADFGHYRRLGKVANFLKNYGGGIEAIKTQLKVSDEIANALNIGYYKAFPKVLDYQKWVETQLSVYGFIENIYGRRYYFKSSNNFYRAYNYLIQGGCADLLKEKQIKIFEFLAKNSTKSKILLPIHDELNIFIANGEEHLVSHIEAMLNDNKHIIDTIPMICEVEYTETNWAEKKKLA